MLLLYSIAIGLILGRVLGGRVRNLEHVDIRWWGVALAGFAVQLILFAGPVASRIGDVGKPIYVISTVVVLVALLRNIRQPGLAILAFGAGLNLVAILSNGGQMPSDPNAWLALTGVAALPVSHFTNVVLMGPDTVVPFLGDIFVWPRPLPMATVFSIGDAIIAVGGVVFLVAAMRTSGPMASGEMPADEPAPRDIERSDATTLSPASTR
jgi:hypothetical protein